MHLFLYLSQTGKGSVQKCWGRRFCPSAISKWCFFQVWPEGQYFCKRVTCRETKERLLHFLCVKDTWCVQWQVLQQCTHTQTDFLITLEIVPCWGHRGQLNLPWVPTHESRPSLVLPTTCLKIYCIYNWAFSISACGQLLLGFELPTPQLSVSKRLYQVSHRWTSLTHVSTDPVSGQCCPSFGRRALPQPHRRRSYIHQRRAGPGLPRRSLCARGQAEASSPGQIRLRRSYTDTHICIIKRQQRWARSDGRFFSFFTYHPS